MLVICTGKPPLRTGLLDGVVLGVKAVFDALGYGTEPRKRVGPSGVVTPCDSSSKGRPSATCQINKPSPGRSRSKFFRVRFSSSKYSLPSGLIKTLKHSFVEFSTGERINFCFTVGSMTAGFSQPICSFDQAQKCNGLPSWPWPVDIVHQMPRPGWSGLCE